MTTLPPRETCKPDDSRRPAYRRAATPTSRPLTRLSVAGLVLLAAGCQVAPPIYEQPIVMEDGATWQTDLPDNVVAGASHGETSPQRLDRWWTRFNDAALERLVEATLANNTNLRGALVNLRIAVLERADSRSERLPSATLSAGASTTDDPRGAEEGDTRFSAGLGATWEADLWGARRAAIETADATVDATREALRDSQVSLVAETALSYTSLRTAQLQLDVTRANVEIQRETTQFIEWQRQVGLTTELELAQARSRLANTRAQIPVFEDSINRAVNRLQVLTGIGTAALREWLLEVAPLPDMTGDIVVGVPADTLRQRPDVRRSEHLVRAQAARVARADAERFPSFTLAGDLGGSRDAFADLFDLGDFARSLAASIGYTLFDGGRLKRNVESQRLQLENALIDHEATLRAALEEAENALGALANSREQQKALITAESSARLAAELAALQYGSGLVDFQIVLDTQQALLDTQSSLASNRGDIMSNLVQLYRSLGGGWQSDAGRVNGG